MSKCTNCSNEATYGISWCNECNSKNHKNWSRTKLGLVGYIYESQKSASKRRGHRAPEYTKDELKEWLYSQPKYHELYSEWVRSTYDTDLKPSVDRKHNDIHYCMSNIQLMTWRANRLKGVSCIYQYDMQGNLVNVYETVKEAAEAVGVGRKNIQRCINKTDNRTSSAGYVWSKQDTGE